MNHDLDTITALLGAAKTKIKELIAASGDSVEREDVLFCVDLGHAEVGIDRALLFVNRVKPKETAQ